ncbi:MAG: hypothetical protein FWH27_18955 [Planctomycetaceae bacterium]|nr:hypothetical protein [Planctomycetaceae bacterium]
MSPTEETPSVHLPTWRDNKTVFWLVRVGFVLQFYIPMIVCCYIVYETGTSPSFTMRNEQFFKFGISTLILLFVQCTVFTLILRHARLRFAEGVLWCLIVINAIHSLAWLMVMWPLTLIRLIPPNALYYIAISVEARIACNVRQEPPQPDTP